MNALDDILRRLDALPSEERSEIIRAAENATKGLLWLPNLGPQTDAYFSPADELFYGGQAGGGKGVRPCEPVLTPFGWRQIGDLKVGSAICATDGTVQSVIGYYRRGTQPVYRLTWSDGSETICDEDHIWLGWLAGKSRKIGNEKCTGQAAARKWTTRQLFEHYQKEAGRDTRQHRFAIPVMQEAAAFNVAGQNAGAAKHISRSMPPYLLGVLLGDGHLGEGGATFTKPDIEIADRIDALLTAYEGREVKISRYSAEGKCASFRIPNDFCMEHLRDLGLVGKRSEDKFIPRIYQLATVEERWELLRGLMDTDGWVEEDGECYYGSTSKQLAEDVRFVARSLGALVTWRERQPQYTYKGETLDGQQFYGLRIKMNNPERMFTLNRKADRCRGKQYQSMGLFLEGIEPAGAEETICISVSHPNSLFIIGNCVVTHNSDLILGLALNEHTVSRIFRKQHNDRQALIERLQDILGTRDGYNGSDHVWRIPGSDKVIRFGAMSEPLAWQRYQGDPTDLKGWDELTQFLKAEYVTVNAWLRTTKPGQRTRIVAAGNPPVTPEGLWVIEYWAPWLDPRHQNPAKNGELRWFTTIDGHEVEVDQHWRGQDKAGLEIKPRSRTFISASLIDNPDLADTGYASTLAQLPKHLRDALADGKFQASLEDDAWQVIPTEWILAAQQRWEQRKDQPKGPMTAIGLDPAQGGPDETAYQRLYGTFFDEPILKEGVNTKNPREVAAGLFAIMEDDCQVVVDCTGGWGNGPLEHLQNNGVNAHAVIYSMATPQRTRDRKYGFANMRAKMIWRLREALDPDNGDDIALPPGRRVVAELAAPRYKIVNRDQILIEPKEDIKKRIGRSPAILDSVVMAWVEPLDKGMRGEKRRSTQRRNTHKTAHSPTVQTSYATARERYSKR